jgi:hypothetical protein
LADGVSTAPLEIWGERHTMYIAYTYCYEKKKKKKVNAASIYRASHKPG